METCFYVLNYLTSGAGLVYSTPMLSLQDFDAFLFDVMGTIIKHHDDTELITTQGIREFLDFLKEEDKKLGIVTSLGRSRLDFYLKYLDLDAYFDVVVTRDDVKAHKPDPEPYRFALEQLGVQPERAIAFEDSVEGVTSAKDAGIFTVLIRPDFNDIELEEASDMVAKDFIRLLQQFRGESMGY